MSHLDRNERKHLYSPAKSGRNAGKFLPEFDPIFTSDSWYQRASGAVNCTLGRVGTGRTLFAYGFVISKPSASAAIVTILEGATVKQRFFLGRATNRYDPHVPIVIGYGNPRAPICRFSALENVFVNSTPIGATVTVAMSWWDAEIV